MKDSVFSTKPTLNIGGKITSLDSPRVMGILNVTPDSFYGDSRLASEKEILASASEMISEGATWLDVGGYSSRPGALHISKEEELERVIPAIKAILKEIPSAHISIDTFRSEVARCALDAGASMVNDISGGELDEKMAEVLALYKVPYVLMHMKGTPQNMVHASHYDDIIYEIMDYFQKKLHKLLSIGVVDVILDLGFGFAKTIEQNFYLLDNLAVFKMLERPILVGISRKSMISKTLGVETADALNGTTALHMVASQNGADILRVHDVKEAMQAIKLHNRLKMNNGNIGTELK